MKFSAKKNKIILDGVYKLVKEGKSIPQICSILNISKSTVCRKCKQLKIKVINYHNSLKFDNMVFDCIDTEEKAYWLGFLYADGNVHSNSNIVSLNLKGSDINHLAKFNSFIKNTKNVCTKKVKLNNKEYRVCQVSVCNKHFKETLISLGCIPKKSLILKFPDINIFKEEKLVYDFIRGYVDGDGCLTFSKCGRLNLNILGTYEFLSELIKYFPGKFTKVHKIKRLKSNTWNIQNCGKNADDVTEILYKNATIYLDRKYDRFAVLNRNIQNNYGAKSVKAEMLIPS